jgi:thiol-disulfide isomerase/thioredoxin
MWRALQAVLMALCMGMAATVAAAQKSPKAEDVLKEARTKAADQNKVIFLIFQASWCEPCHQLDIFLAAPEVVAVFDKYFIITRLSFGEGSAGHADWDNPGSDSLVMKYGGVTSSGDVSLPFIAIVDRKGKLLVNSNRPVKDNAGGSGIGFPTAPEEVSWFLGMLQKTAPGMTAEETQTIQSGLQKAAAAE